MNKAQAATMAPSTRRLVIVESPTKATKIAGYLGRDYVVESSRGHVRDLPTSAAEVPAQVREEVARLRQALEQLRRPPEAR